MINFAFYGRLADIMGRERSVSSPQNELTVGEAVALLSAENDVFKEALSKTAAKYAVGDSIVDDSFIVKSGDEIAILPPFSGG